MKKIATVMMLILAALFAAGFSAQAQTITSGSYSFARNGFAPTDISTGNTQLIGPNADNVASAVTDIGFTFWFAGAPYTQFSVSDNGLMTLGSTAISGSDAVNSMASTTTLPKIAPYWDDLATGTNGSVVYKLTGTAPNRILIVNWNVTVPKSAAGAANALIQVQLSEATGLITFTYGSPAVAANSGQYSIGIGASATDFASVTPTSATAATVAYGTANNANTISPGVYTRYNFTPDATPPTITYTALTGTALFANRTLTATIGDAKTGIPTTGSYVPRIYYKKNAAGTYVSSPGTLTTGNGTSGTWTFTIDHAAIGGVVERDSVYYFVIAQDQSSATGSPNKLSSPSGAVAADVNTVTTYPVAPAVYKILGASISGTKTVGTSGADYTSLTNAGGLFTDINDGKLTGDVTVQIITDLPSETGTVGLNAWTNAGGPFTVTINPVGARTVTSTGSNPLIKLNGAKGVKIDGLNDGTNSLTISCAWGPAMLFSLGASNNTITRTNVIGGSGSGGQGVISFYDASGTFVNCSNNQITDCSISGTVGGVVRAMSGIYFGSWASGGLGSNNVISRNVIRDFSQYGIFGDRNFGNYTISNNEIFQSATGNYSTGIYLACSAGNLGTTNILNNRIHDLRSGTSLGVTTSGILYSTGGAIDVLNIINNVIVLDAVTTNTAAYALTGITLGGPGTSNVYFNSIYIGGTGVTSGNSAGLYRSNGTVNFKNNAVFNARSGAAVSQYYKNFGVAVTNLTNFNSDNNVIYASGVSGVLTNIGNTMGQAAGTDYPTLAAWRAAAPGRDAASFSGDPGFTSATNLTPDPANPNSNILNNRAFPIASIATDAAGNTRSDTKADIGAYEFTPVPVFYTISGNAGIGGATLSWTDSTARTLTTDPDGAYTLTVPYGWSGTVTPTLVGYTFTPLNIAYNVVTANQPAQNFAAAPSTKTISGNAGMTGVTLSYMDSTLKTVTTDGSGNYTIAVPNNWSGTVTPSRAGYTFAPASTPYANVAADIGAQNYMPSAIIYTIAGNAGAPNVMLSWTDTTARSVAADLSGNYSITVSYNWTGTLTPSLAGHSFSPVNKAYANVLANQTAQNFTAIVDTVTISGNVGVPGVQLIWTDGTLKTAETDSAGNFTVRVAYGWSGTITPSLTGYSFVPSNRIYANVVTAQTAQSFTSVAGTPVTISGNAGKAGVTLYYTDISPKTVVSDSTGHYSIVVPNHWSGTVTPALAGYMFAPTAIPFSNVSADQAAQNFAASALTYSISGNAGKAGAALSWTDTTAKSAVSDANGNYSITVSYNWSGTVTPTFAGSVFTPANLSYSGVLSNQINQNFSAAAVQYVISGNAGIAGATLSWTDGIAKTATADSAGNYSFAVSYHWSGSVTPSLAGYTFTPASIAYANVSAGQANQNYTIGAVTYTVSGNAGKAGVTLSWTDGTAKTAVSDTSGNYSITVSYHWSGTVTPSLTGHTFSPANISLANVLANMTAQNFSAAAITYTISGNAGKAGAVLSWKDSSAKSVTADVNGNYSITVSYNWSGSVKPSLAGNTFTPDSMSYANVLTDRTAQNYSAATLAFTISGNAGKAGATVSWTDSTAKSVVADSAGNYAIAVSYNWSGTVTPSLAGVIFAPANKAYANVLAGQTAQNFVATDITFAISGNAGAPAATLSWTDGTAKTATADSTGSYTITVSYHWSGAVTPSLAGNIFVPAQRSYAVIAANQTAQNYTTVVNVNAKVFLQGPFSADTMTTTLNKNNLIPLHSDSAYAASAFGYTARVAAAIPNPSIVDWILVEVRTGTAAATRKAVQAGFLKNDGTIVDLDGVSPLPMPVNAGSYYLVIRHRNHLAVMSAAPVALSDATVLYDFTTDPASAFGANPMVLLGTGRYGMAAGSNDGSILISTNNYNAVGRTVFTSGYLAGDHNMNGSVFIDDYNFVGTNLFLMSQVP